MLRALVLALLLANAGYFAWTRGGLDGIVGIPHAGAQREPERLARQVRAETVKVLAPAAGSLTNPVAAVAQPASANAVANTAANSSTSPAASAAADPATNAAAGVAASAPLAATACLEAGPFGAAEIGPATSAVQAALPAGSWADVKVDKPGSWLVYMGRYGDPDMLEKKKEEIAKMKLPFEVVRNLAGLDPGLSLGRYDDRAAAEKALAQLATRGVKSARLVEVASPVSNHLLRVDAADAALQKQLAELKVAALGKGFAPCTKVAAN